MDTGAIDREQLIAEIRDFMRRVGVQQAIFYGSRAQGTERPHSDLNLVLLSEEFAGRPLAELLQELQRQWKLDIYLEMLPVSPAEFEEMCAWNALACEADRHGVRIEIQ